MRNEVILCQGLFLCLTAYLYLLCVSPLCLGLVPISETKSISKITFRIRSIPYNNFQLLFIFVAYIAIHCHSSFFTVASLFFLSLFLPLSLLHFLICFSLLFPFSPFSHLPIPAHPPFSLTLIFLSPFCLSSFLILLYFPPAVSFSASSFFCLLSITIARLHLSSLPSLFLLFIPHPSSALPSLLLSFCSSTSHFLFFPLSLSSVPSKTLKIVHGKLVGTRSG